MPKPTKKDFHAIGIRNPHTIASRGIEPRVYVSYYPQSTGRASQTAKWVIKGIGFDTNPAASWYDYGCKVFIPAHPLTKQNKDTWRDVALAWAAKEYGIKEWEKSPFGSYHPKGTMAAALKHDSEAST